MNVCCSDIKTQNVIRNLSERICFGVYLDMKHAKTSVVKECKGRGKRMRKNVRHDGALGFGK